MDDTVTATSRDEEFALPMPPAALAERQAPEVAPAQIPQKQPFRVPPPASLLEALVTKAHGRHSVRELVCQADRQ